MPQLHAGVARCDITPPIGIAQGNWSAQLHERSEGIDLPLMCTALAITDSTETFIIAEWDLLYPPSGAWLDEVRNRVSALTGVPGDHLRVSASHTHSGPSLSEPWFEGGAEMVGPYVTSLTDRLAGVCMAAHRAMQPAFVGSGKGSCAVNSNRRRPHQPRARARASGQRDRGKRPGAPRRPARIRRRRCRAGPTSPAARCSAQTRTAFRITRSG